MAGMEIVLVKTTPEGNIDIEDLKIKAEQHAANLSCLMVTYPSTHGVFEETIIEICETIHKFGDKGEVAKLKKGLGYLRKTHNKQKRNYRVN